MRNLLSHFILVCFVGTMTSVSVAGNSGYKVNMTCTYDSNDKTKEMYFCEVLWSECTHQARTNSKDECVDSGNFSLNKNKRTAVFNLTIRYQRKQDSVKNGGDKSIIYFCTEANLAIISGE